MIEKLLEFLLADPVKFVLASSVLGAFYVFKTYDKRTESMFKTYYNRMDSLTTDLRDANSKVKDDIDLIRKDMMKDFYTVKDQIKQINREINYLLEKLKDEVGLLKEAVKSTDIKDKLTKHDEALGKVVWIKDELEKRKSQDEIHYKMFQAIAENIRKLAGRK